MLASMTRRRSEDDLVVALVKHDYAPSRTTWNIRTWDCGRPGTELMTVICGVISWKRRRSCSGMLHDNDDSGLTTSQQETPSNNYKWIILPETRVIDLYFATDSVRLCLLLFTQLSLTFEPAESKTAATNYKIRVLQEIATQSHSRWFISQSNWINHRPTRCMCSISPYNIPGLISEVSEKVVTQIAKNRGHRQPHSHLGPPPRGTPWMCETRVNGLHFCRCMCGSIFIHICAVGCKIRIFSAPDCVLAVQGRSGSSKVDSVGTNRKRVCDFLLVCHCDYGPILRRFWDTATYWLKIACFFYPSLIWRPRSLCSFCNFALKLTMRKLESWGLSSTEDPWS